AVAGEVKSQNAPFVLARCIALRENGVLAWNFVRNYWDQAQVKFPTNTIVRMVDPVKFLNTPELEADVQAFFTEYQIPQAAKTLQQVLDLNVNVSIPRCVLAKKSGSTLHCDEGSMGWHPMEAWPSN
ncbi:MAG: hypothetical protein RIS69_1420, partial [Actinomycetota bacterium]